MKIEFIDGYIEKHENGGTFVGDTAQKLMHAINNVVRKSGSDYDTCFNAVIRAYNER